jgi:hypothetical protein
MGEQRYARDHQRVTDVGLIHPPDGRLAVLIRIVDADFRGHDVTPLACGQDRAPGAAGRGIPT